MPKARMVEGELVRSASGKRFGHVEHVLFHPKRPRAVGFQIRRIPLLYMIDRKPVFAPMSELEMRDECLTFRSKKPVVGRAAEKAHGYVWDETVIWVGMPVATKSGEGMGDVADVKFHSKSGAVSEVALTGGMTADIAIGTQSVEGARVIGFDGERVVVQDEVAREEREGGMAKAAGKGAAVATVQAERVARKVVSAGAAGAKMAAKSDVGKKAMKGLRRLADATKEAMGDGEDE